MKQVKRKAIGFVILFLCADCLALLFFGNLFWPKIKAEVDAADFRCGATGVELETHCDTICKLKSMQLRYRYDDQIYERNYIYTDDYSAPHLKIDLVCVEGQQEPRLVRYMEFKGNCQSACFEIVLFKANGEFLGGERRQSADRRMRADGKFTPMRLLKLGFALDSEGHFKVRQTKSLSMEVKG